MGTVENGGRAISLTRYGAHRVILVPKLPLGIPNPDPTQVFAMTRFLLLLPLSLLFFAQALLFEPVVKTESSTWQTTRITNDKQHQRQGPRSYPYRDKAAFVMRELDLKAGDVAADLGCGTGFWTKLMAEAVGPTGTVHASEVSDSKVADLKKQLASLPQVKPYVCPKDGTGLPEKS
jgi:hypothetical protein